MDDQYTRSPYQTPVRGERNGSSQFSPRTGGSQFSSPHRDDEMAANISMSHLSQSADGRQRTYDTRMAMQRELDGARSLLKSGERSSDEMRRQTIQVREEVASFKAENLRLQDDLRSCKARLSSALDSQEDLLRKNTDKHQQLLELQNRETKFRDDLASRSSLVEYYTAQNQQLEAQLREFTNRSQTSANLQDQQITSLMNQVSDLKAQLYSKNAEVESLRVSLEASKGDIRRKDAALENQELHLSAAEHERSTVRDELRSSINRLESVQMTQDELRTQLSLKNTLLEAKDREVDSIRRGYGHLYEQNGRILLEKAERERDLATRLALAKIKERNLTSDVRLLSTYADTREAEVRNLTDELLDTTSVSSPSKALGQYYLARAEREEADRLDSLARSHRQKERDETSRLESLASSHRAAEREEAERLEALAREHRRKSLNISSLGLNN